MSRGMKLKLAIELSELVLKLSRVGWAPPTISFFNPPLIFSAARRLAEADVLPRIYPPTPISMSVQSSMAGTAVTVARQPLPEGSHLSLKMTPEVRVLRSKDRGF